MEYFIIRHCSKDPRGSLHNQPSGLLGKFTGVTIVRSELKCSLNTVRACISDLCACIASGQYEVVHTKTDMQLPSDLHMAKLILAELENGNCAEAWRILESASAAAETEHIEPVKEVEPAEEGGPEKAADTEPAKEVIPKKVSKPALKKEKNK